MRGRSRFGARSSIFPARLSPPGADRALRRRDRIDSALRRRHPADAEAARRGSSAPGAGDDPDGGRRSAREDPGRRRRRRLSVVEDAPALGAGRGGGAVLRHRGAGAGVPRADGAALRLLAGGRALRDRGSRRRWSRRRGGRRAGCASWPPPATSSTAWRCRRTSSCSARRRRLGRWRRGTAGDPAGGDRALRRGADAAARVRIESSPHTSLRGELREARAHVTEQRRRARRRQAAARSTARLAGPRASRSHRRAQPHARRPAGRALARRSGLAHLRARARARRASSSPRRRAAPLAVLVGPLRRGFALPADRLIVVAEEEIFGARASREARPASKATGLGDLGEIAEGDAHRPRRARHRSLSRPQEAHRARRAAGLPAARVRRRRDLPAGLSHRPRQPLRGRRGGRRPAGQARGRTWQEKRRRVSAEARKIAEELMQLYAQRAALAGHAFPAARRRVPRLRGDLPVRRNARSGEGDRDGPRRHAERRADGPPHLRRRRLRQDRGGAAGDADGGAGRQAGGGAGADHGAGRAALRDLLRTLQRLPGAGGGDVALPNQGRAAGDAGGAGGGEARRRGGDPPTAVARRPLPRSRPAGRRRGAAVRRHPQGAPQGAAHAGRRAHADRHADPAHAADGDGGVREISIIATPPADRLAIRTIGLSVRSRSAGRGDPARAGARRTDLLRPQPDRRSGRAGREDPRRSRRRGRGSPSRTVRWPKGSWRR